MFEVLLASDPHHPIRTHWLSTSVVTHIAIIGLVILATHCQVDAPRAEDDRAIPMFMPLVPAAPTTAPAPSGEIVAEPPPKGFQPVIPPIEIPNLIPTIDVDQRPFDPRDYTGRGSEGVADGLPGGQALVSPDAIYKATAILEGFEPATMVSQPMPRYPVSLEAAGLEDRVMVEFVIDTTGRVEPSSIEVTESTHPAFEAAARAMILGSVFRAARLRTHPVRQLTRQRVRFVATH